MSDKNIFYNFLSIDFKNYEMLLSEKLSPTQYLKYDDNNIEVFYILNKWESDFFKRKFYRIDKISFSTVASKKDLMDSISNFCQTLHESDDGEIILHAEIPTEDNVLLQKMNLAGFRVVESRLHFIIKNLKDYEQPRHKVRKASEADFSKLSKVVEGMINQYDRTNSAIDFSKEESGRYLVKFLENSIKKEICDFTLMPDSNDGKDMAFLSFSVKEDLGVKYALLPYGAVMSSTNKGWYKKLISELVYCAKDAGCEFAAMTTQVNNYAVHKSLMDLGFRIGRSTHVLYFNSKD